MVIQKFKDAVQGLVIAFEEKQDLDFEFWVADDPTGVACFDSTYYFPLGDIFYDLDNEIEKGKIIEYQEYVMELPSNQKDIINYESYCTIETEYYKGFGK
ncbi:MAG: hypothetical protein KGV59_06255 [Tenacibaculum sp.]|nr:hypothetical protein [Tenacibaculum sp.]